MEVWGVLGSGIQERDGGLFRSMLSCSVCFSGFGSICVWSGLVPWLGLWFGFRL